MDKDKTPNDDHAPGGKRKYPKPGVGVSVELNNEIPTNCRTPEYK